MRTEQNLQVINAIAQKNFNPEILEKYTGFGGINVIRLRLIINIKKV